MRQLFICLVQGIKNIFVFFTFPPGDVLLSEFVLHTTPLKLLWTTHASKLTRRIVNTQPKSSSFYSIFIFLIFIFFNFFHASQSIFSNINLQIQINFMIKGLTDFLRTPNPGGDYFREKINRWLFSIVILS